MLFPSRVRSILAFASLGVLASGNLFSLYPVVQVKKTDGLKPTAAEAAADKFFPLETGYFWVYRAKIEIANDQGSTTKSAVPKRVQIVSANKTDKQNVIQIKNEDHNGSCLITYVARGSKVYQFDEFDAPGFEKAADLPADKLRYVFPLSLKQQWGGITNRKKNDGLYSYVVEAKEDVTVPAGSFHDCFRIVFRTVADDLVEWFAPGVGVIKSTYHHNGTVDDELYELESYNVKTKVKSE